MDPHGSHGYVSVTAETYERLQQRVVGDRRGGTARSRARGIGALVDTIITTALDLEERRRAHP